MWEKTGQEGYFSQGVQEKFCKAEQDFPETGWDFSQKLKIVENTPQKWKKIIIKRLWLSLWDPSEIHRLLLSFPGLGPMYRMDEPPLIGPVYSYIYERYKK
jgi:hypothetical protein